MNFKIENVNEHQFHSISQLHLRHPSDYPFEEAESIWFESVY